MKNSSNITTKKLSENWLPIEELNQISKTEASFIRVPKIANIHIWMARRPCGVARILTLASVLPDHPLVKEEFSEVTGLNRALKAKRGTIYMSPPSLNKINAILQKFGRDAKNVTIIDPMAGGGSIPLESLRMGLRTIAIEYNPVAYLILKATLEFPAKFADNGLFETTLAEAKNLISRAIEELGRFYGHDAENYIFARGIRCPYCQGLIPIHGLGTEITKASRFRNRFLKIEIDKSSKSFTVETREEEADSWKLQKVRKKGSVFAKCPYCGGEFQLRGKGTDHRFAIWVREHADLMSRVVEGLEPITPELEEKVLELHIPLVKQVKGGFKPVYGDKYEESLFLDAYRELGKEIFDLKPYIADDPIPEENEWASTARKLGLSKWYMLFNPRQLLAAAKLSKLVAETADRLASSDGEFGAAVALYLAFAVDKIIDYNTIATSWQGSGFKTGIAHTVRGESTLDFRAEFVEMVTTLPKRSLEWALEPTIAETRKFKRTAGGLLPVLRFLCDEFRRANLGDLIDIYLGDATQLSNMIEVGSIDVVNVDPPYYDQVIYSDKSELFWVFLRRALLPVLELLFKDRIKIYGWSPLGSEGSKVPRKSEVVKRKKEGDEKFELFFKKFVGETAKILKDDGTLVLWFTHPKGKAWEILGRSLYEAGYSVSKIYPLYTEMPTRYRKMVNVIGQQVTLAIVAKKGAREMLSGVPSANPSRAMLSNEKFSKQVREAVEEMRETVGALGMSSADIAAMVYGTALSVATRNMLPFEVDFIRDLYDPAITLALVHFYGPILRKVLAETGFIRLREEEATTVVSLLERAMLGDPAVRSFLALWIPQRVNLASGDILGDPLPLKYDFVQTTAKLCGYDFMKMRNVGLILTAPKKKDICRPTPIYALISPKYKTSLRKLIATQPGRAIYMAYLSLVTPGAPKVRSGDLVNKMAEGMDKYKSYEERDARQDAALALVLLSTSHNSEIERIVGEGKAMAVKEIAAKTLAYILVGEVEISLFASPKIGEVDERQTPLDEFLGE